MLPFGRWSILPTTHRMQSSDQDRPLVLLGFADAISAPESAWSLIDDGFRVAAFYRGGMDLPITQDPRLESFAITRPEADAAASTKELAHLIDHLRPAAVLPVDDAALAILGLTNPPDSCAPAHPIGAQYDLAVDQRAQLKVAADAGLSIDPVVPIDKGPDLQTLERFPVEIRPTQLNRIHRGGYRPPEPLLLMDREQMLSAAPQWNGKGSAVALPPRVGRRVTLMGVMTLAGQLECVTAVRWLRSHDGEPAAAETIDIQPSLHKSVRTMLNQAGWRGFFGIDFDERTGEQDPAMVFRSMSAVPGTASSLVRPLGFEYAAWQARQAIDMGYEPAPVMFEPGVTCRHLGLELASAARCAASLDIGGLLAALRRPSEQAWCNKRADVRHVTRAETWRLARRGRDVA